MRVEGDESREGEPQDDWREEEAKPSLRQRWRAWRAGQAPLVTARLDRTERSFLGILRLSALLVAALLVLSAVAFFLVGLALQVPNPSSVATEQVQVAGSDLAPPPASPAPEQNRPQREQPRWERVLPAEFRNQYFALYRSAFAPAYRKNEKALEAPQFFELMFPAEALDQVEYFDDAKLAVPEGGQTEGMRPILSSLLSTMKEAATQAAVRKELQGYRAAQKVEVCRSVSRTRTRWVEQWDYSATNCPYWFEPPYGCMGRRQVSEPYQARECSMQFPDQLADPAQVMRDLQSRYFMALNDKVAGAQRTAELRRMEIAAQNQSGRDAVWQAVLAFAAFLALMFLYLMVALERHHRTIARNLAPPPARGAT
jgi:hypothetical protein